MFRRFPEWIDASAVVVCSGLVAAHQSDQLRWFWAYPPIGHLTWLPLALTTTAAFFGVFQPIASHRYQKKRPIREAWDRHLLHALGDLIVRCQQIGNPTKTGSRASRLTARAFNFGDLGLHVWKVVWRIKREWPFIGQELERVRTVRLGSLPALRQISFVKGKGIVGKCWVLNDEVVSDNESRYRDIFSEGDWLKLEASERDGFSYQEFVRVKDRGAILASPIRNHKRQFIGCVSVDVKTGIQFLEDEFVRGRVQQLCIGLGGSYFEGLD